MSEHEHDDDTGPHDAGPLDAAGAALAASRRAFLGRASLGLGGLALQGLLAGSARALGPAAAADDALAAAAGGSPFAPRPPHFAPRARRVVFLHMAGAPSQLDLFDPKPRLAELDGQPVPESLIAGERFAFIEGTPTVLASPYAFARHGQSGQWISELLPHTACIADKLTVVRSMTTTQFNHAPAQLFFATGHERVGRPSLGSWLSWGLGSEAADLPSFCVLLSGGFAPSGGASCWGSAFLPTVHQGVQLRSQGDPVLFLSEPDGLSRASRRRSLDALADLNAAALQHTGDPEIATRMAQYEMAWRMQSSVPELADLRSETPATLKLYGCQPDEPSFARNCLMARRLLERGTRFVQLYHWGWDSHGTNPGDDIITSLPERCRQTDRAAAALVLDLESRGLLDDTLVIWGGEFGRTPMNERRDGSTFLGRDHHPHAFTMWMAGGGLRPGVAHGETDELGYHVVRDAVPVHDLHATMLHLLGLDHERLTYRHQGRDFRLTDVSGHVRHELLA